MTQINLIGDIPSWKTRRPFMSLLILLFYRTLFLGGQEGGPLAGRGLPFRSAPPDSSYSSGSSFYFQIHKAPPCPPHPMLPWQRRWGSGAGIWQPHASMVLRSQGSTWFDRMGRLRPAGDQSPGHCGVPRRGHQWTVKVNSS